MGFPQLQSRHSEVAGNDRVVGLSGLSATSGLGALAVALTLAASGVAGAGALGSPVADNGNLVLSGVSATSAVGTVAPSADLVAAGISATSDVGSVQGGWWILDRPRVVVGPFPFPKSTPAFAVDSVIVPITGVEATGATGSLTLQSDVPVQQLATTLGGVGTLQPTTPGAAGLTGVEGTTSLGQPSPAISSALASFQVTAGQGTVGTAVGYIDRPHSLVGPFPFLTGGFFQFRQRARLVNPISGVAVTITPTGASATGSVGTLTIASSPALVGSAGIGTPGTLTPANTEAITGAQGTGALGSLGLGYELTGVAGTTAIGSVSPAFAVALSGVSASASIGSIAAQNEGDISLQLSGVAATSARGTLSPAVSVPSSGVAASSSAVGTMAPSHDIQPTAVIGTSALGTPSFALDGSAQLSGQAITAGLWSVTTDAGPVLIGFELDGIAGEVGGQQVQALDPSREVAITGVSATAQQGIASGPGAITPDVVIVIRPWVTTIRVRP